MFRHFNKLISVLQFRLYIKFLIDSPRKPIFVVRSLVGWLFKIFSFISLCISMQIAYLCSQSLKRIEF